ncbi:MAG: diguanylate cyclase response regulator [Nevskia sp.]|nr:diguanylate cyclase response regulator [Nevskia sp.]
MRRAGDSDTKTPLTLLLVEDSDLDADLFEAHVQQSAYLRQAKVVRVDSITAARAWLGSGLQRADCTLLDLGLPDSAGLSGLWQLRQAHPDVPVVLLTAMDDDYVALSAVREGAQDYLVKDSATSSTLTRVILNAIQRQQALAQLAERQDNEHYLATHDPLTGIPNRRMFEERLKTHLQLDPAANPAVIVMLDLNGFKAINDGHGHATGDAVLRTVANRLLHCVRTNDLVARLGGDEFVLFLHSAPSAAEAMEFVERLRNAVAEPIGLGRHTFQVSAGIGVVHYPKDGTDRAALLGLADSLMYADKARGS